MYAANYKKQKPHSTLQVQEYDRRDKAMNERVHSRVHSVPDLCYYRHAGLQTRLLYVKWTTVSAVSTAREEAVTISAVICKTALISCSPPSAAIAERQWMLVKVV